MGQTWDSQPVLFATLVYCFSTDQWLNRSLAKSDCSQLMCFEPIISHYKKCNIGSRYICIEFESSVPAVKIARLRPMNNSWNVLTVCDVPGTVLKVFTYQTDLWEQHAFSWTTPQLRVLSVSAYGEPLSLTPVIPTAASWCSIYLITQ